MYVQMHIALRSTSAHAPLPVDWSKIYFLNGEYRGLVYATSHKLSPNNGISCARKCCFINEFSPYPPPPTHTHTLPRSLALPPTPVPGCTYVTAIAKAQKDPPPPPAIGWNKRHSKTGEGGGRVEICHFT